MIPYFEEFINESSIKTIKKTLRGVLHGKERKEMRHLLRHNIVKFKFIKRNGDVRLANGTLHPSYLPKLRGGSPKPETQMVYFDMDKSAWRSFRSYRFIKILGVKSISSSSTTTTTTSKPVHSSSKKHSSGDEDEEELKKQHDEEIEKNEEKEDEHKKVFKKGDKMSEEELTRRSADFRKGSRKNKHTHEANDKFKKEHKHHEDENDDEKKEEDE